MPYHYTTEPPSSAATFLTHKWLLLRNISDSVIKLMTLKCLTMVMTSYNVPESVLQLGTFECLHWGDWGSKRHLFKWLLFILLFQSAMSFEAGMQPRRHSSSSSSHSFGQIADSQPHGSLRHSHHRHRPTLSPSAAKKHPSSSPQVRSASFWFVYM